MEAEAKARPKLFRLYHGDGKLQVQFIDLVRFEFSTFKASDVQIACCCKAVVTSTQFEQNPRDEKRGKIQLPARHARFVS